MYTASAGPDDGFQPLMGTGVLTVSLDGGVVQVVPLSTSVLNIGRLPDNGLVLPASAVSRHHAEVRMDVGGAVFTDVGSSSGSFIGETRLLSNQPVLLQVGDAVRVGPYVLTYSMMKPLAGDGAPAMYEPLRPHDGGVPALEEIPDLQARASFLPALPERRPSAYLQDLPPIFQEDEFLGRMMLIYEAIWEPLEQRQRFIDQYFDPRSCPSSFVAWLASWLHLAPSAHWPEPRRRRLLAEAMELYRWRGTPYGMTRMIEVCTGVTPRVSEDALQPFTFRVAVSIPSGSDARPEFIEELVRIHKPAHVGYVLEINR